MIIRTISRDMVNRIISRFIVNRTVSRFIASQVDRCRVSRTVTRSIVR